MQGPGHPFHDRWGRRRRGRRARGNLANLLAESSRFEEISRLVEHEEALVVEAMHAQIGRDHEQGGQ